MRDLQVSSPYPSFFLIQSRVANGEQAHKSLEGNEAPSLGPAPEPET